jgi:(2Fe-2S) ferredoxin
MGRKNKMIKHKYMCGYKATDKNMKCGGFQFELGKWYAHEGELKLCEKGFHFCKYPSGVWYDYKDDTTRVFKVEARNVIEEYKPGAELKLVCSEIRLVEEVNIVGNMNTGDENTGYRNTGDMNTGNRNTGDMNTGDENTGYRNTGIRNTGNMNTGDENTGIRNTGYGNTGDRNTGIRNTGNGNTGDRNTGIRNTGIRNTGDWNTGYWNTGDCNTGYGNAAYYSSGFFCQKEQLVISFDKQTRLNRAEFLQKYPEAIKLGEKLNQDKAFNYEEFKSIPGWTLAKCKQLHAKHIEGRKG